MLELEPKWVDKEFQWTSCVDDALATVSNYYGIEYRFAYAKAWDFKYTPFSIEEDMPFSKRLDTSNALWRYHFLESCHKTKMNYHYTENVDELLAIVSKELLNNRPCSIKLDSYNIPWDRGYKNLHTNHVCMPVGIGKDKIFVIDPYNHMKDLEFPISNLQEASGFCITYEVEPEKNEAFDCIPVLIQVMEELLGVGGGKNNFDSMRQFAEDFRQNFSADIELNEYDRRFFWSELYFRLVEYAFGRSFMRQSLLYAAQKYQSKEIERTAQNFRRMISKFNYAIAMMQRTFKGNNEISTGKFIDEKQLIDEVGDIFYTEAEFEERTADSLLKILKANTKKQEKRSDTLFYSHPLKIDSLPGHVEHIDLYSCYNNQAIGRSDESEKADFTGMGEYFLEDDFPQNRMLIYEGVVFQIGRNVENNFDNISCKGQEIFFKGINVLQIDLLLTAEWGSYYEEMRMVCTDGKERKIHLSVTDFAYEPRYGETVVYCGRTLMKKGQEIREWQKKAKIFAVSVEGLEGKVDRIVLPVCERIHIFAIRVVQKEEQL